MLPYKKVIDHLVHSNIPTDQKLLLAQMVNHLERNNIQQTRMHEDTEWILTFLANEEKMKNIYQRGIKNG